MFLISIMTALLYFICTIGININWINDIACYLGYFLAFYLVIFIALVPGFKFIFPIYRPCASYFCTTWTNFFDFRKSIIN